MAEDQLIDEEEKEFEIVEIDHPIHGIFELDIPINMSDEEVSAEVRELDLDLLLGIPGGVKVGKTDTKLIQDFENSAEAGKRGGNWYTHKSIEGGTDSLAYGHKLTPDEDASGFIRIGDKDVDYTTGLTQDQAQSLLDQDINFAQKIAVASLSKVGMEGDNDKVSALTSLIFNVGSGSWAGSKAKKFLESGNMEDFMHQAFSEDAGWVNINGEKSRGLVRRRIAEGELFTRQHRQQVASEATSKGFSFISEAQANELSPALKEATEAAESIIETQGPFPPDPSPAVLAAMKSLRETEPDLQAAFKDKPRLQQVFDGEIGIFEAAGDAMIGEIAAATFDNPELARPGFINALVKGPNARILARGVLGNVSKEIGLPEFITEAFYGETFFGPISESFFSNEEINSLRRVVYTKIMKGLPGRPDVGAGKGTLGTFTYSDQEGGAGDFQYSGSSFIDRQTDPDFRVKATLGSGNYFIDDRQHLIVTDIFNSNDGLALQKKYPSFSERFDNLIKYSKEKNVGAYGVIRRFAALFGPPGSPTAKDDTQGPKFKIDLGHIEDVRIAVENMPQLK